MEEREFHVASIQVPAFRDWLATESWVTESEEENPFRLAHSSP